MHISQTTLTLVNSLRDCVRQDEGGGGQCASVVQELLQLPGFEDARSTAGHFVTNDGNIIDDHWWLVLDDEAILDPTQDQFGEGGFGDTVHLSKKDPRHGHYFPYSGEPGIPVDVLQLADKIRARKRTSKNKTFGEIVESSDRQRYRDGKVAATFDVGPDGITIYEFASSVAGKGYAKQALLKMKQKYGAIAVTDIGGEDDSSYHFWLHMLEIGAVDEVHDTYGNIHEASGASASSSVARQSPGALPNDMTVGGLEGVPQDPPDEEFKPEEFEDELRQHMTDDDGSDELSAEDLGLPEADHPEFMPGGDETHGYDPNYDPQAQSRAPNTNTGHPKP